MNKYALLAPVFLNGPILLKDAKVGDAVEIIGCLVKSTLNLTQIGGYYVHQNNRKIPSSISYSPSGWRFAGLLIPESTYETQGTYQCGIFAEEFMKNEIRSKKVNVQFEGIFFLLQYTVFI